MSSFIEQLNKCNIALESVCNKINIQNIPSGQINYTNLHNELYTLIPLIPNEYSIFRERLRDVILPNLKFKDIQQMGPYGITMIPQNGINPYTLGDVIATIAFLNKYNAISLWDTIHPQIISVSKSRFDDGYYADAVEAAFKEINIRIKKIFKERKGEEKDGVKLMQSTFSVQNPVIKIGDISTETGRDIQQGYLEMFSGAIRGIRNPKAHNNQVISKADAVRKLHFASMLMYKIDNEIV